MQTLSKMRPHLQAVTHHPTTHARTTLYRAMLWSSRKSIQLKKNPKPKLANESAISSLIWLVAQPDRHRWGVPLQSRREHRSLG